MPPDPEPNPEPPKDEPAPTETAEQEKQEEIGDFINRHVFERDSVFFEG